MNDEENITSKLVGARKKFDTSKLLGNIPEGSWSKDVLQKGIQDELKIMGLKKDPKSYNKQTKKAKRSGEEKQLSKSILNKIKRIRGQSKIVENKSNYEKDKSVNTSKMIDVIGTEQNIVDGELVVQQNFKASVPFYLKWRGYEEMGLDPDQPFPYSNITKEEAIEQFMKLREVDVSGTPTMSIVGNPTTDKYTQVLRSQVILKDKESQVDIWNDKKDRRPKLVQQAYMLNRKSLRFNWNKYGKDKDGKMVLERQTWNKETNQPILEYMYSNKSHMRGALQNTIGSNNQFKPYLAKWLYNHFSHTIELGILDFCAGWGGRMLGAMALDIDYIGSDYNGKLIPKYEEMVKDLRPYFNSAVNFSQADAAEIDFKELKGKYDFFFTSPPYEKGGKQVELYEGMKDYDRLTFYTNLLIPAFMGMIDNLPNDKWYCFNSPIQNYDMLNEMFLGKADKKIGLAKRSRAGEAKTEEEEEGGGTKIYKEYIYCYKKTKLNFIKQKQRLKVYIDNYNDKKIEDKDGNIRNLSIDLINYKINSTNIDKVKAYTNSSGEEDAIRLLKTDKLVDRIAKKPIIPTFFKPNPFSPKPKKLRPITPPSSPIVARKARPLSPVLPRRKPVMKIKYLKGVNPDFITPAGLENIREDRREFNSGRPRKTLPPLPTLSPPTSPLKDTGVFTTTPQPEILAGEGFDFITKHLESEDIEGGGLKHLFKGADRGDYPPKVYDFLMKNGNRQITSIRVFRQPLASALTSAMNFLSFGKWKKQAKKHSYNTFFHLGLILTLDNNPNATVMLQKNEVIDMGFRNPPKIRNKLGGGYMSVPMTQPILLNKFMLEGQKVLGPKWFSYDPFKNNCQVFVFVSLRSNRLITPELKDFILQKVDEVVKKQTGFFKTVAPAVTKLGALVNRVTQGDVDKSKYINPELNTHDQTKDYPTHTMPNGEIHTEAEHTPQSVLIGGGSFITPKVIFI